MMQAIRKTMLNKQLLREYTYGYNIFYRVIPGTMEYEYVDEIKKIYKLESGFFYGFNRIDLTSENEIYINISLM